MDERRRDPRVPLDCPVFATLRIADGTDVFCLLRDVSLQGAQVALSPGEHSVGVREGDILTILDPPLQLDGVLTNAHAEVAWVREGAFGIRFRNSLEVDHMLLEKLLSDVCL